MRCKYLTFLLSNIVRTCRFYLISNCGHFQQLFFRFCKIRNSYFPLFNCVDSSYRVFICIVINVTLILNLFALFASWRLYCSWQNMVHFLARLIYLKYVVSLPCQMLMKITFYFQKEESLWSPTVGSYCCK